MLRRWVVFDALQLLVPEQSANASDEESAAPSVISYLSVDEALPLDPYTELDPHGVNVPMSRDQAAAAKQLQLS